MTLKEKIYENCKWVIADRMNLEMLQLRDLVESTNNETKSSAGDKYETSRALLQIEQDNVRKRLHELSIQQSKLELLNVKSFAGTVQAGSLVYTNKGIFFLSIALGKIADEQNTVIALSEQSPLGRALLGAKIKEVVAFNGSTYQILNIE